MTQPTIGSRVRLQAVFQQAGVATDPGGTIRFIVVKPSGTDDILVYPTDPNLVKDSVGTYHYDYLPTQSGHHTFRPESGLGAGQAADEIPFYVSPSQFSGS